MVSFISYFSSISSNVNHTVKLPNGALAHVTHMGTMHLSNFLILHNVLCIPTLSFNLISTSKLSEDFCWLIFLTNVCLLGLAFLENDWDG